ncbi:Lipid droplet-associated hydrolase [Cytospora mali]|uniref:Lipid droplet-associated hydrolase n=1 Tax=Cytospora mali TaxID=578113 RepID=A0A194V8D4_CYTMA|nr:Lipid droplet-associated hydrolase [Valsa mali var. pyri (nom. inval.)]
MAIELSFPSPNPGHDSNTRQYLIYFITGNPGLIDYYEPFLSHLRALLNTIESRKQQDQSKKPVSFHIYGRNLAGFEDTDHPEPFNPTTNPPHNVEYEIQFCLQHLIAANSIPTPGPRQGQPFDEVILIGHSLGTYIALELFHRHLHDPAGTAPDVNLKSGILLFATISHLAKSPKGVKMDLLRRTPFLNSYAPIVARTFLSFLPTSLIGFITRRVLGMPPHAAAVTTRFLTSRDGVYQTLYLGMDEMAVISDEAWAEELWEIGDEAVAHAHEVPKFFIFFGKNDHWVSNEYRDEFIKRREEHAVREEAPRHKRGRTRIVLDEADLPHDFCTHHSETVAEKVSTWVDEIAGHP